MPSCTAFSHQLPLTPKKLSRSAISPREIKITTGKWEIAVGTLHCLPESSIVALGRRGAGGRREGAREALQGGVSCRDLQPGSGHGSSKEVINGQIWSLRCCRSLLRSFQSTHTGLAVHYQRAVSTCRNKPTIHRACPSIL